MNSTRGWEVLRSRNRKWSWFAMLSLPPLATLLYTFVHQFYWQASGIIWFLVYFAYSLHGILYGVFTTQLVIWWHWQSRESRKWLSGTFLLFAYLMGIYLTSVWWAVSDAVGFVPASLVCLGYSLAGIATHWFTIVAIGSVSAVHIVDVANSKEQITVTSDATAGERAGAAEIPESQDEAGLQPEPFSIATLMLATLVSALIFVLLRWSREVYSVSGFAGGYPESDVGQIAGMLSSAFANSLCMLAAVCWYRHRSIGLPLVLVLIGLIMSMVGRVVGLISDGAWATPVDAGMMLSLVLDSSGMLLLHGWLLQKWNRAGYRFR